MGTGRDDFSKKQSEMWQEERDTVVLFRAVKI